MRPEPNRRPDAAAAGRVRVLEAALQAISDPFLLLNRSFRIEEVNRAMAALLGTVPSELLGRNPLVYLRPDKRRQLKKHAQEVLLSGKGARFA